MHVQNNCAYVHVCMYVYVCVCMYACMNTPEPEQTHPRQPAQGSAIQHVCMYVYVYAFVCDIYMFMMIENDIL